MKRLILTILSVFVILSTFGQVVGDSLIIYGGGSFEKNVTLSGIAKVINADTATDIKDYMPMWQIMDFSQPVFEKELSDSENNIDVGFNLASTTLIFYNGILINNNQWSGEGTNILYLYLQTRYYDNLTVKK